MTARDCVQVIHKKKGLKTLLKKLESLQDYQATVGIHKGDGRKKVSSNGKNPINTATLAKVMETDHDIKPTKDLYIETYDGSTVHLAKDATYHQPARYFIKLQNVPEQWSKIKSYLRQEFLDFIGFKGRGRREGTYVFKRIGSFAEKAQKYRIINAETAKNGPATEAIKGFNHPLLDTGHLLDSISSRVTDNRTDKKIRFSKIADDIEKSMMKLNK